MLSGLHVKGKWDRRFYFTAIVGTPRANDCVALPSELDGSWLGWHLDMSMR